MNKEKLKDLSHEFDNDFVGLNLNLITLKSINAERTKVYFQIDNVNDAYSLALTLCNMEHTFAILFDLMNFTVKELVENLEDVDSIKDDYFGLYNIWCWWKKSTGTFFMHKNRKQVNFPLKLKSTKTKSRREITCLILII